MVKLLPLLLLFNINNTNSYAFDNPYVDTNIDKNIADFVSSEIVLSFSEAIGEYNKKRGTLPKIIHNNQYYTITKDESKVEFDIPMFLSKTFLLNGRPIRYKDINELKKHTKEVSFFENISIIDTAYADQFADSSKSNRILFASIIALEGNLKDAGYTNNNSKLNFAKITAKIDSYNDICIQAQQSPEEFEEVGSLLKSMAKLSFEMKTDKKKIKRSLDENLDEMLDDKLGVELKEGTCEKQMAPLLKSGLLNITAYAARNAESVDTVAIPSFCTKIENLRQCLSNAYNNNNEIIDTVWRDNPKLYLPGGSDNHQVFKAATGVAR